MARVTPNYINARKAGGGLPGGAGKSFGLVMKRNQQDGSYTVYLDGTQCDCTVTRYIDGDSKLGWIITGAPETWPAPVIEVDDAGNEFETASYDLLPTLPETLCSLAYHYDACDRVTHQDVKRLKRTVSERVRNQRGFSLAPHVNSALHAIMDHAGVEIPAEWAPFWKALES